jgi:hypothetical protein
VYYDIDVVVCFSVPAESFVSGLHVASLMAADFPLPTMLIAHTVVYDNLVASLVDADNSLCTMLKA